MAIYTFGITYSRSEYFDVEAASPEAALAQVRAALIHGIGEQPARAGHEDHGYDPGSLRDITEMIHD